jgi:hypothetical protein
LISDVVLTAMELAMFFIVFERRSERLALAVVSSWRHSSD